MVLDNLIMMSFTPTAVDCLLVKLVLSLRIEEKIIQLRTNRIQNGIIPEINKSPFIVDQGKAKCNQNGLKIAHTLIL